MSVMTEYPGLLLLRVNLSAVDVIYRRTSSKFMDVKIKVACDSRLKGTSTLTKSSLQITRKNFKNQICLKF